MKRVGVHGWYQSVNKASTGSPWRVIRSFFQELVLWRFGVYKYQKDSVLAS